MHSLLNKKKKRVFNRKKKDTLVQKPTPSRTSYTRHSHNTTSNNSLMMMITRLVLLLTLLLLPVNGSGDAFDVCDEQISELSVSMMFDSLPENLDADEITSLQDAFKTTYNSLTDCATESLFDVVGVEIIVQQRRRLEWFNGFFFDLRVLRSCRGCPKDDPHLFNNDAPRRSLAQEPRRLDQGRSLQDCPPCKTPTPVDFIDQFNSVMQENALATAAGAPNNVIGAAVSVSDLVESLSHSVCGNFAVHARTALAFNGEPTTIHDGNVGVFPGTSVNGPYQFQDGGEFVDDSSDFAALTVVAHTTAMAVRNDETAIGIEIGGSTFTPGTYRSGSAINIASGTVVTLDGEGDPNSVFLFQAVTTLVTGADTSIIMTNGARADNVVWVLGTAATLGASSVLQGSILAGTAITLGTKSELHGCALAQTFVSFESEGSIRPTH